MVEVVSLQPLITEDTVQSQGLWWIKWHCVRLFSEHALSLPYNGYRISVPWIKWRERDSDNPLHLVERLKKE
jgi:hypothetical protein